MQLHARSCGHPSASQLLCCCHQVLAALSEGRTPEPEPYDCVTVIFCDLVDFSLLSAALQPQQVTRPCSAQPAQVSAAHFAVNLRLNTGWDLARRSSSLIHALCVQSVQVWPARVTRCAAFPQFC